MRPFFPSTVYFSDSPGVEERLSGGRRIERDAAIAVKESSRERFEEEIASWLKVSSSLNTGEGWYF